MVDVAALMRERDEADRAAGAAARRVTALEEQASARSSWFHRAKRDAGYDDETAFDLIWADALAALLEKRRQPPPVDGMPIMDNGLNSVIEGALELVRKHDPGMRGLLHNLERLQSWIDLYVARARAGTLSPGSADEFRGAALSAIETELAAPPPFIDRDWVKGREAGLTAARDILLGLPTPLAAEA